MLSEVRAEVEMNGTPQRRATASPSSRGTTRSIDRCYINKINIIIIFGICSK
jgi:hypothetical protein